MIQKKEKGVETGTNTEKEKDETKKKDNKKEEYVASLHAPSNHFAWAHEPLQ
jgi:hypothetical protein